MKATFTPRLDLRCVDIDSAIRILIVDESGPGVEIRIHEDGSVTSGPLHDSIERFRSSPLWEEVLE